VISKEKTIAFDLLDNSLSGLVQLGIRNETSFDAPGTYMVCEIVRRQRGRTDGPESIRNG
jgi:hypothetical protein